MRKWWIVFVAGTVAVGSFGCGGGGGAPPPPPPPPPVGVTAPTVNLINPSTGQPFPGNLTFTVLTGPGRRLLDEIRVTMSNNKVQNGPEDLAPENSTDVLIATITSFTLQSASESVPVPAGSAYRLMTEFPLEFNKMVQTAGGTWVGSWIVNPPIPVDVLIARGRHTSLMYKLNEEIITEDDPNPFDSPDLDQIGQSGLYFDREQFEAENISPLYGALISVFGDYISFDLTAMTGLDRPNLDSGAGADKFLVTGDLLALAAGFAVKGTFQILEPEIDPGTGTDQGVINAGVDLGGTTTPGTYTVFEQDPSVLDPNPNDLIVSLTGIWRPYTDVLSNIGDFAMIVFPNSRNDVSVFTAVYIARDSSGNVTALWQGPARLFDNGIDVNELRLTRVKDIVSGLEVDPAVGTLSNFTYLYGEIATGTFTLPVGTTPGDFPFPLTGEFRVFRI